MSSCNPNCMLNMPFEKDTKDWSGNDNNNNGTAVGIAFNPGIFGHAAYFAGSSGHCIVIPQSGYMHSENMTIAFWIYVNAVSASANIINKRTTIENGYTIFFNSNTTDICFRFGGFSTGGTNWDTGYIVPVGKWTHVAFTRSTTRRELYINGKLQASTASGGSYVPIESSTYIGRAAHLDGYYLNGSLDNLQIYNMVLPASDIARLMLGLHPLSSLHNYIYDQQLASLNNWLLLRPEWIRLDNTYGKPGFNSAYISVSGQTSEVYARLAVKPENYVPCKPGEKWQVGFSYYLEDYTTVDNTIQMAFFMYASDKTTTVQTFYFSPPTTSNGYKTWNSSACAIAEGAAYIRYIIFSVKRNGTVWFFAPNLYKLK